MSAAPQDHLDRYIISEVPGFLRAWVNGDLVFVKRSVLVRDDSSLFEPVIAVVGSRSPSTVDRVPAVEMAGREAEWLLYEM